MGMKSRLRTPPFPASSRSTCVNLVFHRYRRTLLLWMLAASVILVCGPRIMSPLRLNNREKTVMIVLGIRESPENLALRVLVASATAKRDSTEHVIFTGGAGETGASEARAMRDLWPSASKANVTFHLEEDSQSTCQNSLYSIPILQRIAQQQKRSIDRVLVVTNDFHVPRTKLLFEQVFATEGVSHIFVDTLAAPTVADERASLFRNEFAWLEQSKLKLLLEQMTNRPFRLPSKQRIEQARSELRNLETTVL